MFQWRFGGISVISPWCHGDALVMFRSCFGFGTVVSQRCFGDVSVMSRCCFGIVGDVLWFYNMFSMFPGGLGCVGCCVSDVWVLCGWCFVDVSGECRGEVSVMFQWCLSDGSVMSWWCFLWCLGFVSVVCQWCPGFVLSSDVSVWLGWCVSDVLVLSRRCFEDMSVMSRLCVRNVFIVWVMSQCYAGAGGVSLMFLWCLGDALVMSRWYPGYVLFAFHGWFGDIFGMLQWFFGDVSRCFRHVLVMFWWSLSDVSVMSRACLGDV